MTVTLFTRATCPFAYGAEALVRNFNLDVNIQVVEQDSTLFNKVFPAESRFTPSIYDSESGVAFTQSIAVNDYLISLVKDHRGLLGSKPEQKFEILQWEAQISNDLVSKLVAGLIVPKIRGVKSLQKSDVEAAVGAAERTANYLNQHLTANTFLVGEQVTLADVFGAPAIAALLVHVLSPEWRQKHQAIVRWVSTIVNGKYFGGKLGSAPIKYELPTEDPLPKFYSGSASKDEASKKAPAQESQPAKPVHPLAQLGKSSIPIDELKRTYSNKETREEALPYFWNTFYNDEEWSIWKVDYKYNDELTLTFMSNNLIGGFFHRLFASTKFIFGAAVVYGENNNNGIQGAFVVRGKDFKAAFDVAPDWECYSFTRLDASNPEDRAVLEDLWAWDKPLVINGEKREIVDGKVFK